MGGVSLTSVCLLLLTSDPAASGQSVSSWLHVRSLPVDGGSDSSEVPAKRGGMGGGNISGEVLLKDKMFQI